MTNVPSLADWLPVIVTFEELLMPMAAVGCPLKMLSAMITFCAADVMMPSPDTTELFSEEVALYDNVAHGGETLEVQRKSLAVVLKNIIENLCAGGRVDAALKIDARTVRKRGKTLDGETIDNYVSGFYDKS
jgi:hypothetical protein